MRGRTRAAGINLACLLIAVLAGCAARVVNLNPAQGSATSAKHNSYAVSVQIERFSGAADKVIDPNTDWDGELAAVLRDTGAFSTVIHPPTDRYGADVTIRGAVHSSWQQDGSKNFFTYFPGGLVFAPAWRGMHFQFNASARIDVLRSSTGEILETFEVATSHELIHRSANPAHFLGAATIIPGVVRGALMTWPRGKYSRRVYDSAYPELWKQVAERIINDQGGVLVALEREGKEHCGGRLSQPPTVGERWSDFLGCQSETYATSGQHLTEHGTASVYVGIRNRWRIHVVDGKIVEWSNSPAVSAPPAP